MKSKAFIVLLLCTLCSRLCIAQDIDTELTKLSETLSSKISDQGKKKIAVVDFTDLQGASTELGKYIAEQLTVDLVMNKKDFAILDRANLKSILAEHKLTSTGLVDPENAKKLGMFAGVDALILGTIIPKGSNVVLTAKIITTDTAEIVGAAKTTFHADETIAQFVSQPANEAGTDAGAAEKTKEKAGVSKSFGDLRVTAEAFQVVDANFKLTMTLANQNAKKSIWVALNADTTGAVTDAGGNEYKAMIYYLTGIQAGRKAGSFYGNSDQTNKPFDSGVEIKPGDSITATVKFESYNHKSAAPGDCNLQLEFLLGHGFNQNSVTVSTENFVAQLTAQ